MRKTTPKKPAKADAAQPVFDHCVLIGPNAVPCCNFEFVLGLQGLPVYRTLMTEEEQKVVAAVLNRAANETQAAMAAALEMQQKANMQKLDERTK